MRKFNTQQLIPAVVVAAVYFVLCHLGNIFQLTFGPVQTRLGEMLTVLPFLFPVAAPGLTSGCLPTNILSPYGPIDAIVGALATAIAAFLSTKVPRWYLAALSPVVVSALLLPPIRAWTKAGAINGAFWAAYGLNLWTFVAREAVACYAPGTIPLKTLLRVWYFRSMIPAVHLQQRRVAFRSLCWRLLITKARKAAIPAAGLGIRMLPAIKTTSKEMLPMVDKPVIQYIIEEVTAARIEDILIITNWVKSVIDDYSGYYPELEARLLQSGKESELVEVRQAVDLTNISYVRQKEMKGLGHVIGRARRFVGDEPFAVLLGDDVMRAKKPVTLQLAEAVEKYGASVLGVQGVATEAISRYSSVKVSPLEERIFDMSDMSEKPTPEQRLSNYTILGHYVLIPEISDILENIKLGHGGETQPTDGLRELCRRSRMVVADSEGRRYNTGNLCGFLETTIDFVLDHPTIGAWLKGSLKEKVETLCQKRRQKNKRNAAPQTLSGVSQTGEKPSRKESFAESPQPQPQE